MPYRCQQQLMPLTRRRCPTLNMSKIRKRQTPTVCLFLMNLYFNAAIGAITLWLWLNEDLQCFIVTACFCEPIVSRSVFASCDGHEDFWECRHCVSVLFAGCFKCGQCLGFANVAN